MTQDIFQPIPVEPVPRVALSVVEAAKALGVSDRTVTSMISRGEIPVVSIGKRRLIPVEGLREWVRERTESTKGVVSDEGREVRQ